MQVTNKNNIYQDVKILIDQIKQNVAIAVNSAFTEWTIGR